MCGFQSTALGRKAIWDVRRLARLARFSPVPILLALTLTSACAGLASAPGEIAAKPTNRRAGLASDAHGGRSPGERRHVGGGGVLSPRSFAGAGPT